MDTSKQRTRHRAAQEGMRPTRLTSTTARSALVQPRSPDASDAHANEDSFSFSHTPPVYVYTPRSLRPVRLHCALLLRASLRRKLHLLLLDDLGEDINDDLVVLLLLQPAASEER